MKKILWIVVGTRPEVIKQIAVYWAFRDHPKWQARLVAVTQHQELLRQALEAFGAKADLTIEVPRTSSDLLEFSSIYLREIAAQLDQHRPDSVMVQGDTSTAFLTAQAAFYRKVPVFHNEAGLRSHDLHHPFPEEANRRWISTVAQMNFAPTETARKALIAEGHADSSIHVVGNSGLDAFAWSLKQSPSPEFTLLREQWRAHGLKPVLVTSHRRESNDLGTETLYKTLAQFTQKTPNLFVICPLHPNNSARTAAEKHLGRLKQARLVPPLDYVSVCHLVNELHFALTDSGGLQEECGTLNIPVVVARMTTERREVIDAGLGRLVAPENAKELELALDWAHKTALESKHRWTGIYGDGHTGDKIAKILG